MASFLGVQFISAACTFIGFAHNIAHLIKNEANSHHHEHSHEHEDHSSHKEDQESDESCCSESSIVFLSGIDTIPQLEIVKLEHKPTNLYFLFSWYTQSHFNFEPILWKIRPPPLLVFHSFSYPILYQSFLL